MLTKNRWEELKRKDIREAHFIDALKAKSQIPKKNKGYRLLFFEDYLPKHESINEAVRKFCEDKNGYNPEIVYGWIREKEQKDNGR